jgi:orotate phosphoribosyltransferase-like protein
MKELKKQDQNPTRSPAIAARRRKKAFALRLKGLTWAAVGESMGISGTAAQLLAHRHTQKTGAELPERRVASRSSLSTRDRHRLNRQSTAVRMRDAGESLSAIADALSTSPAVASRLVNEARSHRLREREERELNAAAATALHRAGLTWSAVEERMGKQAVARARRTPRLKRKAA